MFSDTPRIKLAALLTGALGLLLLLFWSYSRLFIQVKTTGVVGTGLSFSQQFEAGKIRFFNGWGVVDYDIAGNSHELASDIFRLPETTQLRWSHDGKLFLLQTLEPLSNLDIHENAFLLYGEDSPVDPNNWMLVEPSTKTIVPLKFASSNEAFVEDAAWYGRESKTIVVLAEETDGSKLYISSFNDQFVLSGDKKVSISTPLALLIGSYEQLVYAVTDSGALIEINMESNQSRVVAEKVHAAQVSPDNGDILYQRVTPLASPETEGETDIGAVVLERGGQQQVLAEAVSAVFGYNELLDLGFVSYTDSGGTLYVTTLGEKVRTRRIQADAARTRAFVTSEQPFEAILQNSSLEQYFAYTNSLKSRKLAATPELTPEEFIFDTVYEENYSIGYYAESGEFHVQLATDTVPKDLALDALEHIRLGGVNPYFQSIRWIILPEEDRLLF